MSAYRISGLGRVAEAAAVNFTFDGKRYQGRAGDSLASALLANGVLLMGRSFKYHRPRGLLGAGAEEPNALISVDRGGGRFTPNLRATAIELYEGLDARSQNRWPSLQNDLGAINDRLGRFFPAGFYNKTFMWPRSFWEKLYEPAIRRMAGLGDAPTDADPDVYDACYAHCDVLIVGAGPAGIDAALAASASKKKVILIDEQDELGGGALADPTLWPWLAESLKDLAKLTNVTLLPRTTAFGYYHDNFIGAVERLTEHLPDPGHGAREKLWRIRAGEVVLAQGAIERPLVFAGNDVPGVMLASAARTYLNRFGVAVGRNVALMATHDSGWRDAFALARAGVRIAAIVDLRETVDAVLLAEAAELGVRVELGSAVIGVAGRHAVEGIEIARADGSARQQLDCDAVLMAGGWTPSVHLWSHSLGKLEWSEDWGAYLPGKANENVRCLGACGGKWSFGSGVYVGQLPTPKNPATIKAFVDFQNDVTAKDIALAIREGMKSVEHIKRYTTNGMATDQGKTSNLNALQLASAALDRPVQAIGLTTFRPPYTPQTFGALAGHAKDALFQPTRKTPIDPWAEAQGAVFEPVAQWRRARYFPKAGEDMHAAVARECLAVRQSVGIFDASTLGKIEVVGPDAAEFLNRMYTNPWKGLEPGRCRYGLLLREDGFITDDGVSARLAPDRFHLTTTTGGAARVLNMMEDYLQTEWPDLNVWLTSTTEQWAVIAVQGPKAREVIAPLVSGIDLSGDAFPHMAVREGTICGVPTRLFRVSFTGELGFEINVPSAYGRHVWEAVWQAGQAHGIIPYGTETMHVLRAEKGFIIVGQDTDGTVTPYDAGLDWAVGKKKADFVGKRSLARPDIVANGRKQLVGLLTDDPAEVLVEGAQIVEDPNQPIPMKMIGHVTSSYWSASLGRSIAMALVAGGFDRMGDTLHVPMPGRTITAKVVKPMFYDAEGSRLNV
ncbi:MULTISPECIES: 2Fe-2S iron-sulfur cluster-binding protein [unclassified Novosphingobium]|uniref:2Fe-2S iron-sulfur cluster-binding protein n=1 Tax=unclassified Novosphingobium TaxID=2644732 RepID=UPI000EDB13D3|nr:MULTISPECIES: 2Fe-2S iron-sulfur cluster-binding protein [unclassified Novosphingobium]HCF24816.1 sarcosine oxidase subunit alpha [Novosphingobium sp.]HQV01973.1 glycine cleavage T C-terminal barrel domain-containing protein [Novosphingobium sp.]